MAYDNNMSGALFTAKEKRNANSPDYTGSCEIDGVEYWMSGWKKKAKSTGKTYLSLAFSPKNEVAHSTNKAESSIKDDFEEDIPF